VLCCRRISTTRSSTNSITNRSAPGEKDACDHSRAFDRRTLQPPAQPLATPPLCPFFPSPSPHRCPIGVYRTSCGPL
jgi:hypothetical protein